MTQCNDETSLAGCDACEAKDEQIAALNKKIAALKKAVLSARHDADEAEARLESLLVEMSGLQRRRRGD